MYTLFLDVASPWDGMVIRSGHRSHGVRISGRSPEGCTRSPQCQTEAEGQPVSACYLTHRFCSNKNTIVFIIYLLKSSFFYYKCIRLFTKAANHLVTKSCI